MTHTQRHIAIGVTWLIGFPLALLTLAPASILPLSEFQFKLLSYAWGGGLVATFGSWSIKDAPTQGRPIYVAMGFTAAWLAVFAAAVIPYLFVTRGLKNGAIASLWFLAICTACYVVLFDVLPLFGGIQELAGRAVGAKQ